MQEQSSKSTFSRIGLSFFLFLLIGQILGIGISLLVALFLPQLAQAGWFLWVVSYAPLYCVGFPVFMLIMRKVPDTATIAPDTLAANYKPKVTQLLMLVLACLGVVYPLNILANLLSMLLQHLTGTALANPLAEVISGSSAIMNLFVVCIVAPVMEEYIFRGILHKKLAGYGAKTYVFFSAFLFMLYHINLFQMGYAFVLGLIFALLTWYTGTIRYSIILHMVINLFGGGVSSLLLAFADEHAMSIWGLIVLAVAAVGLVVAIVQFVKYRKILHFEAGALAAPSAKDVLVNGGMSLMILLFLLLLTIGQLLPLFMGS